MNYGTPPLFDAFWFRLVFGFVIGGILGSFATMLAYRLPRRISIFFPRSRCSSCNTTLGVRDLVPIFSWLCFKGHCRHCHAKIGIQYLVIEIATSTACAAATVWFGFSPLAVLAYLMIIAAVVILSLVPTRAR